MSFNSMSYLISDSNSRWISSNILARSLLTKTVASTFSSVAGLVLCLAMLEANRELGAATSFWIGPWRDLACRTTGRHRLIMDGNIVLSLSKRTSFVLKFKLGSFNFVYIKVAFIVLPVRIKTMSFKTKTNYDMENTES